ncbi:hypothetical protein BDP27DRAFT_24175 [Rhodocollybia butyracea]|uniref:FAD-binding domain-containing protein n=1 Tax=Rhodocollybia butyracea TaxID=206335 RepID=A0A9P5UGR4_9AGAR|nr:hypothetical protein BDP27DRAFT_24175 [Rhodocollybia butyracea]
MELSADTLKFVVVGGGIAGLTSAYLLKQSGHEVVILEKSSCLEQMTHGGIKIPPNMTRLMHELPGAEELLNTKATKCEGISFLQTNGDDPAELVGKLVYVDEIMSDLGADFYLISHKDLHNYLLNLCHNAAVEFRYNFEVEDVITNKLGPTVVGKSGETVIGDIVIGADGKNSVIRKVLLDEEDEAEESDSRDSLISVPISLVQSDPELVSFLAQDTYGRVFLGNGTNIFVAEYGPDLCQVELTYGTPPEFDAKDDDWLSCGTTTKSVLEHVEEYDPRIKKLIQLVPMAHWNVQGIYNLPQYVSKLDQVVVIGDAAHAIYINGTHNTAAAFEDAFTLGRLFAQSTPSDSKSHASLLLNGYQQIRHKRTKALEKSGMNTMILMGLVPGPERSRRNQGFRLTLDLDGADDATVERIWSEYIEQFHYEPRDEVSEWWMNWARPAGNRASSLLFGVAMSTVSH